jgi:hypothetical protein
VYGAILRAAREKKAAGARDRGGTGAGQEKVKQKNG